MLPSLITNAQCGGNINLNTWIQEGPVASGIWTVNAGGSSLVQTTNGQPTFFVSPNNFINVKIRGKFHVDRSSRDDDMMGFVFGFQNPSSITIPHTCKFNLFDWKQKDQVVLTASGNVTGKAGFMLAQVDTLVDISTSINTLPLFFGRSHRGKGFNVMDTDYGATRGWAFNKYENYFL